MSLKARDPLGIIALRLVLGSLFILASVQQLGQIPTINIVPAGVEDYIGSFSASPGFFNLIMGTQLIAGSMICFNVLVPLGLVFLAPISVHIFVYSVSYLPSNIAMASFVFIAMSVLFYFYKKVFAVFFRMQIYGQNNHKSSDIIILQEFEEKYPAEISNLRDVLNRVN